MRTIWASEFDGGALNSLLSTWAAARIFKDGAEFGSCATLGIFEGDQVKAVAVLHNWDERAGTIEISAASETRLWLTRPVLRELFTTIFERMGCQMTFMRVAPDNGDGPRGLHRLLRAYGFDCLALPRFRGRDKDDLLFTLTEEAWRSNGFN